jgi:hypothetical protein
MSNLTRIMPQYSGAKILRSANVEMIRFNLTLEDIDVCELVHLFWGDCSFRFAPFSKRLQMDLPVSGLPSRNSPPNAWCDHSGPPSPRLRRDSLRLASDGE